MHSNSPQWCPLIRLILFGRIYSYLLYFKIQKSQLNLLQSIQIVEDSDHTRKLKQLRRRRREQLQRTTGLMIKTTALYVDHAFKYISLTSTARVRCETS